MSIRRALLALLIVPFLLAAGCGDDDSGGGGGGGEGGAAPSVEGAKVIDPASMDGAKGNITFCSGKDTSGSKKAGV
jgi:hypothetical protein